MRPVWIRWVLAAWPLVGFLTCIWCYLFLREICTLLHAWNPRRPQSCVFGAAHRGHGDLGTGSEVDGAVGVVQTLRIGRQWPDSHVEISPVGAGAEGEKGQENRWLLLSLF